MDFNKVKNIHIPEGNVIKITDSNGIVLWQKKGVQPDLPTPNGYELYYTSTDGNIVKLSTLYNGVKPISNTYENGIGRMLFEKELTEIGQEMFDSCNTLQTIILPNSITTIVRWGFYRCVNLTNITIPDSVTNIDNGVFQICNSLNQITSLNPIAPTLGKDVFFNLPEVGTLYIPEGASGYDVWLENLPEGWSIQYIVPDIPDNPDNPDYPELPEPLANEIYYTSTDGNIVELNRLYSDTLISNTYENGIGKMVFKYNLTTISNYGFQNCSSLQSIVIPEGVTKIYEYAFSGCSSLQSIVIPEGVTYIENNVFRDCSNLQSIIIPESVTYIGNSAFDSCSSLQSIVIPEGVTKINNGTFYGCSSLQSIELPEGLEEISFTAFHACSSLQSIVIPEGLTTINQYAFKNCSALQSIILPETVVFIWEYAFENCYSLHSITCKAMRTPTIKSNTFTNIGTKVPSDTPKVLRVPEGATGYDSGDWKYYVIDKGFELRYITE